MELIKRYISDLKNIAWISYDENYDAIYYQENREKGDELMKLLQISTLWLALFLVMGAGCGEQKQKSKERGQAIVDTVKDADKNINDAVLKMQENLPQLEEEEEVEADN